MRERDVEFDVIEYLENPLTGDDLEHFLDLLPDEPAELVRKDKNFKALGLDASEYTTRFGFSAMPSLVCQPVRVMPSR